MPTLVVAIEQSFPQEQRIIDDGLAGRMLPVAARVFVRLVQPRLIRNRLVGMIEKSDPGLWAGLLRRKRYIDEKIADSSGAVKAVVNLGAGFDTRAYRLPLLSRGEPRQKFHPRRNIQPSRTS